MKKTILAILILITFSANSQTVTIPVTRISQSNDSTLFNFRPYTVYLSVMSGASFGNLNFYYKIIDSIAAATPHVTPFGQPFTRSNFIEGNITLPNVFFLNAFDSNNKPILPVFNQLLGFMDMQCDTLRPFIIK